MYYTVQTELIPQMKTSKQARPELLPSAITTWKAQVDMAEGTTAALDGTPHFRVRRSTAVWRHHCY